jgi:hypothetical protein
VPFSFVIVGVIGVLRAPCIRCRVGESLVRVSVVLARKDEGRKVSTVGAECSDAKNYGTNGEPTKH